jgi:hypothetical protein
MVSLAKYLSDCIAANEGDHAGLSYGRDWC